MGTIVHYSLSIKSKEGVELKVPSQNSKFYKMMSVKTICEQNEVDLPTQVQKFFSKLDARGNIPAVLLARIYGETEGHLSESLGPGGNGFSWDESTNVMKKLSKDYPEYIFMLHENYPEYDEASLYYWFQGKVQKAKRIISYEPFNEMKLK